MEKKVGIILPGDPNNPDSLSKEKRNLHGLFDYLAKENIITQLFVYNDTITSEIETKLQKMSAILVWFNPIENGIPRTKLDAMLRRLSNHNIFISSHPDVILKLGTKEVLFSTKELSWGSDVELFHSENEMKTKLLQKLQPGISRVLKQNRGNSGDGVWRIELSRSNPNSTNNPFVKVLHATRNSIEQEMPFLDFVDKIRIYFNNLGKIIDQEFISPEPDGMVRSYMTQDKVVGFGQQYVTSLIRPTNDIIESTPRIYFSKDKPEYQDLRSKMEQDWIPQLLILFHLDKSSLPIIWDADFLFRPDQELSKDRFVLCEINVSSVFPFPPSAVTDIVLAMKNILRGI